MALSSETRVGSLSTAFRLHSPVVGKLIVLHEAQTQHTWLSAPFPPPANSPPYAIFFSFFLTRENRAREREAKRVGGCLVIVFAPALAGVEGEKNFQFISTRSPKWICRRLVRAFRDINR
jgi:hypothetical protein